MIHFKNVVIKGNPRLEHSFSGVRPALFCWNFNCHLHIRKANSHEKVCAVHDAYFNNAARAIEGDKNFQPLCRKIIDDAGTGVCVTSIATHTCRRNQDAVHLNQYTQVAKLSRITKICNSRSYVIRFELQIYFRLAYANQNKHQVNATCLFHRGTIFVDKIKLFQNFIIIILRLQWNIFHIFYIQVARLIILYLYDFRNGQTLSLCEVEIALAANHAARRYIISPLSFSLSLTENWFATCHLHLRASMLQTASFYC